MIPKVKTALAVLLAGRTSCVVAHRLSTIRRADLVLDHGHIVERGTHHELLQAVGPYRHCGIKKVEANNVPSVFLSSLADMNRRGLGSSRSTFQIGWVASPEPL